MSDRSIYEFTYRGQLAESALDKAGRKGKFNNDATLADIDEALNFDLLDADEMQDSVRMARVYAAITAFEKSARIFIKKVMQSEHGETWWAEKVPQKIQQFAEDRRSEENTIKWHGTRGDDLLTYTEMGHLAKIIENNWDDFQPHIRRIDWAKSIFSTIERSRNVIMHSGHLEIEDIERVGMNIRDWVKQVGA